MRILRDEGEYVIWGVPDSARGALGLVNVQVNGKTVVCRWCIVSTCAHAEAVRSAIAKKA